MVCVHYLCNRPTAVGVSPQNVRQVMDCLVRQGLVAVIRTNADGERVYGMNRMNYDRLGTLSHQQQTEKWPRAITHATNLGIQIGHALCTHPDTDEPYNSLIQALEAFAR